MASTHRRRTPDSGRSGPPVYAAGCSRERENGPFLVRENPLRGFEVPKEQYVLGTGRRVSAALTLRFGYQQPDEATILAVVSVDGA